MGRRLRLCNVPTIKQTWPWQISFESPFTKRSTTFAFKYKNIPPSLEARGFRFKLAVDPPILNTFAFISKSAAIFLVFLSISKEPISCSVGQGFEPQWAKNLRKNLPYPKCFNIDVVTRSPIKKQRNIQKNLQINDKNVQIFKSQKCGTSPKFFLVFSAFGPITWIIFPHTECPKLDPKLPHIALPGWFLLEDIYLRK